MRNALSESFDGRFRDKFFEATLGFEGRRSVAYSLDGPRDAETASRYVAGAKRAVT